MRFVDCLLNFYFCFFFFDSIIWLVELPYSQNRNGSLFTLKYSISWLQCLDSFVAVVVQSLSHVQLFATSWSVTCQVSLSSAISWSLLKLMSIWLMMPSNHLILCHPLLLLHSVFLSIRVFSSESALCIRWPKYWSFSFSLSPSNKYSEFISFRIDWFDLQSKGLSIVFYSTTIQKYQFFGIQPSLWSNSHIHKWLLNVSVYS